MSNPSKPESEGTGGLQSKLLLVVSGVLIPLVAAAIPYIIEFISPKSSLVFESVGPVVVEDTKGFSLSVRNEGKTVERNIEVWLPSKLEKGNHKLESSQPLTLKEVDKATVLVLGDIRPSEKVDVSLLVQDRLFFVYEHRLKDLRIVSSDSKAIWGGRSDEAWFIYRTGFYAALLILLLAIVAGLYQEHFMSRAMREKMILREMGKLK